MIRRKDGSKSDDDPGKTIKNNCANIEDIQFESIRTGETLSMCLVPVKVQHKTSDKAIMMFAMLYLQSRYFCNYQLDGAIKYFWYTIIH